MSNDFPEYAYHGDGCHYLEEEYFAHECDDQLPLISAVGAGPRGEGLRVKENLDGNGFVIESDLTGEVVYTSPNLSPAKISIRARDGYMLVDVDNNGKVTTYRVNVPKGDRGSRFVVTLDKPDTHHEDDGSVGEYYVFDVDNIYIKDVDPAVGDLVVFAERNDDVNGLDLVSAIITDFADGKAWCDVVARINSGDLHLHDYDNDLKKECKERIAGDGNLKNLLDQEITKREIGDKDIIGGLNQEAKDRKAADTAEAKARADADTAETAARDAAIAAAVSQVNSHWKSVINDILAHIYAPTTIEVEDDGTINWPSVGNAKIPWADINIYSNGGSGNVYSNALRSRTADTASDVQVS